MGVGISFNLRFDDVIRLLPAEELNHMRRVGEFTCELIGTLFKYKHYQNHQFNITNYEQHTFYHDIGKAWVPHRILAKKDALNQQEYEAVILHPIYAQQYFENNSELFESQPFLKQMVYDAAVFHHERWDGKGYPFGIYSGNIPFIARVISVCDAYDAMTHQRPYGKVRTHKEACDEIKQNSGTQFDPDIASVFLENDKAIRVVHRRQLIQEMEWKTPQHRISQKNDI